MSVWLLGNRVVVLGMRWCFGDHPKLVSNCSQPPKLPLRGLTRTREGIKIHFVSGPYNSSNILLYLSFKISGTRVDENRHICISHTMCSVQAINVEVCDDDSRVDGEKDGHHRHSPLHMTKRNDEVFCLGRYA